jgi:transposase
LLNRIAELFALEADIRGQTPEQRLAVRTEWAAPLLARIKTDFESTLAQVSGKSALAMALAFGPQHRVPQGLGFQFLTKIPRRDA